MKYIDIKEFVKEGYLQELNRQFLHPLGLALCVYEDDDGSHTLSSIWDMRDDPEGIIFSEGVLDKEKALNILKLQFEKFESRVDKLGYTIQPLD